jgi:hypothetical protein
MLFGIRGIEESSVYQDILRKGQDMARDENVRAMKALLL